MSDRLFGNMPDIKNRQKIYKTICKTICVEGVSIYRDITCGKIIDFKIFRGGGERRYSHLYEAMLKTEFRTLI